MSPGNALSSPVRRIVVRAICSGLIVTQGTGLFGCGPPGSFNPLGLLYILPGLLDPELFAPPSFLCSEEECGDSGMLLWSNIVTGPIHEVVSGPNRNFTDPFSLKAKGFAFAETSEGLRVYVAAKDGLWIYDGIVPNTPYDRIEVPDCVPLGDVVVLDDGRVVVSCLNSGRLRKIDPESRSIVEGFSCCEEAEEPLDTVALALSPDGSIVLAGVEQIEMFDVESGEFLGVAVDAGVLEATSYDDFLFGPDGNLYVSANPNVGVLRFDADTFELLDVFIPAGVGQTGASVFGLAFDKNGDLFLSTCCSASLPQDVASILKLEGKTGTLIEVVERSSFVVPPHFLNFRP